MSSNIELAPMEGATPAGGIDNAPALRKQKDDFGVVPIDEATAEATMKAELAKKPISRDICQICRTVHCIDGNPICICNKCGHMCRIVWCGQCVCCAYTRFSSEFGEGVAERLYPDYAAHLHKQREEQVKANKLPWES